ncbi:MAG: TonB-dependent receptor [Tannerellaceae bacterium]|nr:TonB-dependent receptor [Tannerellaceae bacterium]
MIFRKIEAQSDFKFFFQNEQIRGIEPKSLNVNEEQIEVILAALLRNTNLAYQIEENHIVLFSRETEIRSGSVAQQGRTVSGKVMDSSGEPLMGVSVLVKGTLQGTTTDMDGNYNLPDVAADATLVFSFIGMLPQEIKVNGRTAISASLEESATALGEVVAIGYGTMRKSDLTGASGSVKDEVLEQRTVTSFSQALSGKVSGVNISTNSGRPGGRATVRIRGNSSISVTNEPLYVVDGVILNVSSLTNGSSPIDYLNPNDIKSVEVLKDASATAIYGARGANGVIMISTKRGEGVSGTQVRYDTDFGLGVLPRKLEVLNAAEFLQLEDLAYANAAKYDPEGWNAGVYKDPKLKRTDPRLFDANGKPLYDTDWQDEATRSAFAQTHQLSVIGSKGKDSYGISLGFRDEDGVIINSWLKRYSGRFFVDMEATKWLTVGGSLSFNYQQERQTDSMGDGGITVGRQMVEELPFLPVKYADGSYAGNNDYPGMEGGNSPVHVATDRNLTLETQTMLGNVFANIKFAEGLEFRSVLGANIINQKTKYYGGRQLIWISSPNGRAYVTNNRNNSWQFENYLTYNKTFSSIHRLTGMLGLSWQHVDNAAATADGRGFQDDFFLYNNLGVATTQVASSSVNAYGLNSYFARVNYNLKERYLLTATARIDGSSKFGRSNRYAFFPSVGLAWRVSEEDFLKSSDALVSNLKPRVSYGVTGNSETGAYASQGGLGNYTLIFSNAQASGIGVSTLANPELKWEKTTQVNAGFDLGLLNNRINIEADLYYKKTTDMLLGAPVPYSSGYTTITKNIGSMENKGIEFAINTVNINKADFSWETSFNISFNQNKVLALSEGGDDIYPGPDILSNSNNIIRVGEPVGSFYGYKRLGTWGTDEAAEAAKYGLLPGDLKLWDKDNDGQINNSDRLIIGKGIPDAYGTFSNSFRYKNFDLVVELQYMLGNDVLNIAKHSAEDRTGIANSFKTVLNAWTPSNQNTMIAEIRPTGAGYTTNIDSHFVEDGSFVRGRNLLLGYTFPGDLIKRIYLKNLRVYGSVQNFFVLTKFSGYDPEVSDATQTFAQGITVFGYPKPCTFTLGLNVSF